MAVPFARDAGDPVAQRRSFFKHLLSALLFGALVLCGQTVAALPEPQPAPLFVDCRGERGASPLVILEAGAFGTSADWDYILDDLSGGGRVCAYDRGGLGRSPDRGGGRDVLARAEELNTLLTQLGESGPVILVGHSNGGIYIEAFARRHPEQVAGLVYVNAVNASAADDPLLVGDLATERKLSNLAVTAAHLGLAGLVADQLVAGESLDSKAAARKRRALTCAKCLAISRDEDRLIVPGLAAVGEIDDAGVRTIPTAVIVGAPRPSEHLALAWRAAEIRPAGRAERSWVLDAPGASHTSPLARDRAYIDAAVAWLRSIPPRPLAPIGGVEAPPRRPHPPA